MTAATPGQAARDALEALASPEPLTVTYASDGSHAAEDELAARRNLAQSILDSQAASAAQETHAASGMSYGEIFQRAHGGDRWANLGPARRACVQAGAEAVAMDVFRRWKPEPAPELAALRELLGEIGVTAANAPEDGDSFGLLEEIAMRIAAAGVPDSTPPGEWPDPENPVTGRTPGAAAPELAAAEVKLRETAADNIRLRELLAEALDYAWRIPDAQGETRLGRAIREKIAGIRKRAELAS